MNLKDVLKADRPTKLPPKFEPKLTFRLTCQRTNQVVELSVAVPVEGLAPEVWDDARGKIEAQLRRLGYLEGLKVDQETEPAPE
jgi:hypothetical protein